MGLTRRVDYHLTGIATTPLGSTVTDDSTRFGETFCATLRHLDPSSTEWGVCDTWFTGAPSQQAAETRPLSKELGVITVAGIFSQCFESQGLHMFQQGMEHLKSVHGLPVFDVSVSGVGSSEANAKQIDTFLQAHQGNYLAIGYSKGIADLMVAIQSYESARTQIKVLASVAGAVTGSRLADWPSPGAIAAFESVVTNSGLGDCDIQDAGGLRSLRRDVRNAFLRTWRPPAGLRTFSMVGISSEDETSHVLRPLWNRVSYYSIDQDSQVIVEEGIVPGSVMLGVARADHWAIALPFWETGNPTIRRAVHKNRFPRSALLEAIVRTATE